MTKHALAETAADLGHNWLLWFMAGLGISTMDVHEFIGGLFLAVAGASIIGRARRDPRKLWFLIAIALFAAVVTASVWPSLGWQIPIQVGMAAAGAASSYLVNLFVKVGGAVEGEAGEITQGLIARLLKKRD